MARKLFTWFGVIILTFSFIGFWGSFVPLGPIPSWLRELFEDFFVEVLIQAIKSFFQLNVRQDDMAFFLTVVAIGSIICASILPKNKAYRRSWLLFLPMAGYTAAVCLGSFYIQFIIKSLDKEYAAECIHETTTNWHFWQFVDLFINSNWPIAHCRIHQRPFEGVTDDSVANLAFLGLLLLPVAVLITFLLRRLDINNILYRNIKAALSSIIVVFGLGQIDFTAFFAPSTTAAIGDIALAQRVGESFRDCDFCPEMVVIPDGAFTMGSTPERAGRPEDRLFDDDKRRIDNEWPLRQVTVQPLAVGKYEITWQQWQACVDTGGCEDNASKQPLKYFSPHRDLLGDAGWGRGSRPVINISWQDAQAYLRWLSAQTGQRYRLLTEAEWEYVARAGSQTRFSFGDDSEQLCRYANIKDAAHQRWFCQQPHTVCEGTDHRARHNGCHDGHVFTAPAGSLRPNPFGLYDLHGNVMEWVEDCYRKRYVGAPTDGSAVTTGDCNRRVVRGGSMEFGEIVARSAHRSWKYPDDRAHFVGMRVAREL
ncbi:MAG: formylglycine-generating enzyme family protein [Candidatus Competibacterales bacterium]